MSKLGSAEIESIVSELRGIVSKEFVTSFLIDMVFILNIQFNHSAEVT